MTIPSHFYRRMQEEAPLYHNPEIGFWALTRFDDVLAGLADWEGLSSAKGTLIEQIQSGKPPPDMMIFKRYRPATKQLRRLIGRAVHSRRVAEAGAADQGNVCGVARSLVEQGGRRGGCRSRR